MPEYLYNNKPLPEWQIQEAADEEGVSFEEFLENTPDIVFSDKGVTQTEVKQPKVELDDDSLEQPNIDEVKEMSKTDSRLLALEALQRSAPTPGVKIGAGVAQSAYGFLVIFLVTT